MKRNATTQSAPVVRHRNRTTRTLPSRHARLGEIAKPGTIEPAYVSVIEAELVTGLSRWYWRKLAYSGQVESAKFGSPKNGRLLIPLREIRRVMAEATRPRTDMGTVRAAEAR